MKALIEGKVYVLTARAASIPKPVQDQVLGPFDDREEAALARCQWALGASDAEDRAEILTARELASDYLGRYGSVQSH